MNCLRCGTPNEEGAKFCKNCGMDLSIIPNSNINASKKDVYLLLSYISWHFLTYLIYLLINKVIVPKFIEQSSASDRINNFYKITDWVISSIDIVFLLILIFVLNNKSAKIFVVAFALIRLGLLLVYQVFK